jgi:hypothetical protein
MRKNLRVFIICILYFAFNSSFVTEVNDDGNKFIEWKEDVNLTWDDFKANPEENVVKYGEVAGASTFISCKTSGEGSQVICQAICYFNTTESWSLYTRGKVKLDSLKAQNLLNHEKGHFDIAEICARNYRKAISKIKANNRKNAINEIKRMNLSIQKNLSEFQNRYDKETNHSENREKQAYWNKQISKMLKDLSDYKESIVIVNCAK